MNFIETEDVKNMELSTNSLWVEKYRPINLNQYIGDESFKLTIENIIKNNEVNNLLLFGDAGGGKCLDFSELVDIEIDLTRKEYDLLKKYEL